LSTQARESDGGNNITKHSVFVHPHSFSIKIYHSGHVSQLFVS
jgi:hypothetical protein